MSFIGSFTFDLLTFFIIEFFLILCHIFAPFFVIIVLCSVIFGSFVTFLFNTLYNGSIQDGSSFVELGSETLIQEQITRTESCEWFNLLFAKILREHLTSEEFKIKYLAIVNEKLRKWQGSDLIGDLCITRFDAGNNSFHIIDPGVQMLDSPKDHLRLLFNLRYFGPSPAKITLQGSAYVNWPTEKFAVIPIELDISLEYLSGPVLFDSTAGLDPLCTLGFTCDPASKFSINTRIGEQSMLKNIPKISEILVGKIKQVIRKEFVSPNGVLLRLPIKSVRPLRFGLLRKFREESLKNMPKVNRNTKPKLAETRTVSETQKGVPPPVDRSLKSVSSQEKKEEQNAEENLAYSMDNQTQPPISIIESTTTEKVDSPPPVNRALKLPPPVNRNTKSIPQEFQ